MVPAAKTNDETAAAVYGLSLVDRQPVNDLISVQNGVGEGWATNLPESQLVVFLRVSRSGIDIAPAYEQRHE